MNSSNMNPPDWLGLTEGEANELLLSENLTWPYLKITIAELYSISDNQSIQEYSQPILKVIGSLIPVFGILFNACLLATLWNRAMKEKNSFFVAMLIIAILDGCFCVFNTFYNSFARTWSVEGFWDAGAMIVMMVLRGLAFSCSLASDLCALCVTLERYVSIARPQFYRNLSAKSKRLVFVGVLTLIFVLSSTRMHYTFRISVVKVGSVFRYADETSEFLTGLATISDTIISIGLVIGMSVLSTRFRMVVIRRRRFRQSERAAATCIGDARSAMVTMAPVDRSPAAEVEANPPRFARNKIEPLRAISPADPNLAAVDQPLAVEANRVANRLSLTVTAGSATLPITSADNSKSTVPRTTAESNVNANSIILITYALDVLALINNFGYCLYFVAEIMIEQNELSYSSDSKELQGYSGAARFEAYAAIISVALECVSRSINFPVYMSLSRTMRREFKIIAKKVIRKLRLEKVLSCA